MAVSPTELLDIARTVATEAGELVARRRREGVTVAATKSTSIDVVTLADRECEEFVKARLAQLRPEDGFYGEEGGDSTGTSGLTWIVDPIDGTVNYLYGIPQYAVSIAVVEGNPDPASWKQAVGVVNNPAADELYFASKGGGAFLLTGGKQQQLHVNEETDLAHALVATGFGYSSEVRAIQAQRLTHILPAVRDIRRAGAASLDLCAVAAGRLDGYFESGTKPWDHGAGSLIAREAGAVVGGLYGAAEGESMLLASNKYLFPEIEKLLIK
ncbi:inositol monophosphatase family protein [Aurantimicrobium sp. MWH-Uga1]|uniref:inositol monophosphatase family protein n=1 Tax=Aurantimicrobium sp. MWH-Uga1 TaxID=2079575 RepID=UPI000DED44C8|nr:inositol monophosphatase family protein [Aurantimicrobium sp. MWH-Uga1]AXE55124.1 Inositol-1-monophosphatase SuhB [Aurantimicrobium sp. MWH-Uga1]